MRLALDVVGTWEMESGGTGIAGLGLLTMVTGAPFRSACTKASLGLHASTRDALLNRANQKATPYASWRKKRPAEEVSHVLLQSIRR